MFVLKSTMEEKLKESRDRCSYLEQEGTSAKRILQETKDTFELKEKKWEIEKGNWQKDKELSIEKALNELRNSMNKALIESDLQRVQATASLEAYKSMDTHTERAAILTMLEKAIGGLSAQTKVQVLK